MAAADLTNTDTVVEIGPGLGVLTGELAGKAGRVVAVEMDGKLAAVLEERMASRPNVVVINKDILKVEPASLLQELPVSGTTSPLSYKVVANLPHYINSAVLRRFLEAKVKPPTMAVMVPK